ncbi:MAG: prolyl oligopeptidase family serine peptidase [Planctomycetales bacterium]|nr:prolyl oligopeptidase family serine peptidase [Planctomycetales bacterium]
MTDGNRTWCAFLVGAFVLAFASGTSWADGSADNTADSVRRIPKIGVEVSGADRAELTAGLAALHTSIEQLRQSKSPLATELLPDVLIFHRAVDQALRYREFFEPKEVTIGKALLKAGQERADQLLAGEAPWTKQTGRVVRGYISKIDRTVQPIGLLIPASYKLDGGQKHRLDFWFHGRGENLSEVNFLNDRSMNDGQIAPADTIVLHPYGRYCNANKLAGEIDSFEALDAVRKHYRIDNDRIAVRGFSMGGAAVWQFAVHYPDLWFAANPGAGFSETPDFLKVFQSETLAPTWYERKLWQMYDCTGYAANLAHLPTIAYSGEIDKQKQAADIMAVALKREGMDLLHIIGPMTAHKIHPDSAKEIDATLNDWATKGINRSPLPLQFVTYSLRYNRMHWLTVDGLKEHWEEARMSVKPVEGGLAVAAKNVTAFTLRPPKTLPRPVRRVAIDGGSPLEIAGDDSTLSFVHDGKEWKRGEATGLRKRHGLQGPIDDAFLDSFVFVQPGGSCRSDIVEQWSKGEFTRAVTQWRQQMRGDAVVKRDTEVTEADIASSNLVLWGDSKSNAVLAKIIDKLPIRWTEQSVVAGDRSFDGGHHALIAIYPNPLNPEKYVVLNSSFTYREYDYLNNARQVPKLPDWAIVDVKTPANSRYPGKVVAADFFDEQWRLKPATVAK